MANVEIKRGYEVLPDNNIRFGIKITNVSELAVSDVEAILDFTGSLFKLEGERMQKLGNIPPSNTRTAEFILKPLGCVHKVNIEAILSYRDPKWEKHVVTMHPKEVHCVCPFLKGMEMPRAEFLKRSGTGHSEDIGLNFKGVDVERLTSFLVHTCKNRHYMVDNFSIDGGRMLYLASESIGEKAYYLLTALIKESKDVEGLTQVMLRAVSDKSYGLNGFLNETVADLRHVVSTVQSAQEIGIIKKEQVINIIDSVVQRTSFGGGGGEGSTFVNIQDSVVQRTEFDASGGRSAEEERGAKDTARREQEYIAKKKSKTRTNVFMLAIVLGALLVGFAMFAPGSDNASDAPQSFTQPEKVTDNRVHEVTASESSSNAIENIEPDAEPDKAPVGNLDVLKTKLLAEGYKVTYIEEAGATTTQGVQKNLIIHVDTRESARFDIVDMAAIAYEYYPDKDMYSTKCDATSSGVAYLRSSYFVEKGAIVAYINGAVDEDAVKVR